jgi:hypothetical protein
MQLDQQKIQEVQEMCKLAMAALKGRYREFLASIEEDVAPAIWAFYRLETELVAEHEKGDIFDFKHHFLFFEKALIALFDEGSLTLSAPLTALGEKALADLRKRTGIYPAGQSAPAPAAKPLSADEFLEQEVRNDFATLRSDKMREKRRNDRRYEAMYQKIADTLGTLATAYHDGSGNAR